MELSLLFDNNITMELGYFEVVFNSFVCFKGSWRCMPTLPGESNPYLQSVFNSFGMDQ